MLCVASPKLLFLELIFPHVIGKYMGAPHYLFYLSSDAVERLKAVHIILCIIYFPAVIDYICK